MEAAINTIQKLIQEGKKIEAIKVARETFQLELKDAKELVEAIEQGKPYEVTVEETTTTTEITSDGAISDDELIKLLEAKAKLQAVKLVKETRNIGLKEAKEYIDNLEAEISQRPKSTSQDRSSKIQSAYQEDENSSTNSVILWIGIAAIAALLLWYFVK